MASVMVTMRRPKHTWQQLVKLSQVNFRRLVSAKTYIPAPPMLRFGCISSYIALKDEATCTLEFNLCILCVSFLGSLLSSMQAKYILTKMQIVKL